MNANEIVISVMDEAQQVESVSFPPFAKGQGTKYILLEDLRYFLCTAICSDLSRFDKNNVNAITKLAQELVMYYHILGYSDKDAQEKIISIVEGKEEFDGE